MARPLVFQNIHYFYAIGNTAAVSLLRDVPPEQHVDLLLVGCGDPRNVLFSIYDDEDNFNRRLDFTCSDIDPAILARNVIMYTMLADNVPIDTIWNIFFHFYIDKKTLAQLKAHCEKLLKLGKTTAEWVASEYGRFIKMGTEHTLNELRRHWQLYIDMHNLPPQRLRTLTAAFSDLAQSAFRYAGALSVRSAGPLIAKAGDVCVRQATAYWKTGTTFTNQRDISSATLLNPTFVYSFAGEGAYLHYGTDPVTPFHLAELFSRTSHPSVADVVKLAKGQFASWSSAFRTAIESPSLVLRFIASEALTLCRALNLLNSTNETDSPFPAAQWKSELIQLRRDAPSSFHIIDTSNLSDHLGILNILTVTIPLLRAEDGIIYTESLISEGADATKELVNRLHGDIDTMFFLFGVYPVDYVSGFASRCNTHEWIMHDENGGQFHHTTTWKKPISADSLANPGSMRSPVVWDSDQLGALLFRIYHLMFEGEDADKWWSMNQGNTQRALHSSNNVHYIRESFVLMLQFVRERFKIPNAQWIDIMNIFIRLKEADLSLLMDPANYQDLAVQLYMQGVYTVHFFQTTERSGPFAKWDVVPPVVRVFLVVPREKLPVLDDLADNIGSPNLECHIYGVGKINVYTAVNAAFGMVLRTGTTQRPDAVFKPDPKGLTGSSPFVLTFLASAMSLSFAPASSIQVSLSVRNTPASSRHAIRTLGVQHIVFGANVLDTKHVHIIPQVAAVRNCDYDLARESQMTEIGPQEPIKVILDEKQTVFRSLSATILIENVDAKASFASGTTPKVSQLSPCVLQLEIANHLQNVIFPIPIRGTQSKLRLARKSSYIEIIVPPFRPFQDGGMKSNPFPVVSLGGSLHPWNIHRVNLSRCPTLRSNAPDLKKWLDRHLGSMFSQREFSLAQAGREREDVLACAKSITEVIVSGRCGLRNDLERRVVLLGSQSEDDCDLILFVDELKLDLPSHTILADAYVLPFRIEMLSDPGLAISFRKLMDDPKAVVTLPLAEEEARTLKQLLPALAERCRSWRHLDSCEYRRPDGRIPLSVEMGMNPLCSCGSGKDVANMKKVLQWRPFAQLATRIALSPLFVVTYLEAIARADAEPQSLDKCSFCNSAGKPKLLRCSKCAKVTYCSQECQHKDWKAHKPSCK
ncbi:hypothetical protein C8F01DRAFT_283412 [Mycena amicta]|nr:hypothetical protein C8F01DRAFT_283412 [Mycena amicta]